MGSAKHTPGPWFVSHVSDQRCEVGTADNPEMVTVWGGKCAKNIPADQVAANALLIAAAPELLEALKALVKVIAPDGNIGKCEQFFKEPLLKAAAAIAKAEGRA